MTDRVSISVDENGVADVRLNRPDKMNALDPTMFDGICDALEQIETDKSIRVVVLSGEGRAFCAGLDMGNFANMAKQSDGDKEAPKASNLVDRTYGDANKFQHVAWGWHNLSVPVIAAIHGVAIGGGFQIACGADIRFARPDARFSVLEMKWGLVPDMGGMPLMRGLAGDDIVRELCYTARMFDGELAHGYGFVTHLSDNPLDDAMELAREIAGNNPDAVRGNKELLNLARDGDAPELLLAESRVQAEVIGTPNQIEAVMAGLAKRPGNFKDAA
jgi:enoyl-CoA hydratase/carnithine racemase